MSWPSRREVVHHETDARWVDEVTDWMALHGGEAVTVCRAARGAVAPVWLDHTDLTLASVVVPFDDRVVHRLIT